MAWGGHLAVCKYPCNIKVSPSFCRNVLHSLPKREWFCRRAGLEQTKRLVNCYGAWQRAGNVYWRDRIFTCLDRHWALLNGKSHKIKRALTTAHDQFLFLESNAFFSNLEELDIQFLFPIPIYLERPVPSDRIGRRKKTVHPSRTIKKDIIALRFRNFDTDWVIRSFRHLSSRLKISRRTLIRIDSGNVVETIEPL